MARLDVHAGRGAPDDVSEAGLDELRARIDRIDEAIVEALAARFALSRETGARKTGSVHDPGREAAVIAHVVGMADELGLEPSYVAAVYEVILRISVQDQLSTSTTLRA